MLPTRSPYRTCRNCSQRTPNDSSFCNHCNSPELTECRNCEGLIPEKSDWCFHCGAPQGLCQHCEKYVHRYVDGKCEKCETPFMCRPEFERKQAAKNTKENLELVCYLTGILIALVLAIYVAVKAYSFIVGYFSP